MTRAAKISTGAEYVSAIVPIHSKSAGIWQLQSRKVAYYPELGETPADAETFAAAIVASMKTGARSYATIGGAASGHDHTTCPTACTLSAAHPGTADHSACPRKCPTIPARGAVSADDLARRYRGDDAGLADAFAAFLGRDRAESRASVRRLAERVAAERAAETARKAAADVARMLATSGPTAYELAAAARMARTDPAETVRYQDAPAPAPTPEPIAEPIAAAPAPEPTPAEQLSESNHQLYRHSGDWRSCLIGGCHPIAAPAEPAPEGPYIGTGASWNPSRGWSDAAPEPVRGWSGPSARIIERARIAAMTCPVCAERGHGLGDCPRPMPAPVCLVCAAAGRTHTAETHTGPDVAAAHAAMAAELAPMPDPDPAPEPIVRILPAAPAPERAAERPACPRCGQTFRRSGTGYAWHLANRPDCAEPTRSAAVYR